MYSLLVARVLRARELPVVAVALWTRVEVADASHMSKCCVVSSRLRRAVMGYVGVLFRFIDRGRTLRVLSWTKRTFCGTCSERKPSAEAMARLRDKGCSRGPIERWLCLRSDRLTRYLG